MKALAIKYRPQTFDDVSEQESIKIILQHQIETKTFKHAYLFCGGAGTGKTTCARIFARELNHGTGGIIEQDAASNNSVDDVRKIEQQAKTKALDAEYKVFILDECHSLSNSAWQAMLKLIEEPPATSIFIFCTTDPQKIPKTILSRVQRYDFKRISQQGIVDRLQYIFLKEQETEKDYYYDKDALEFIAKLADGGMRDAITLLDKSLSYSPELTEENVVKALGTVDYEKMIRLTNNIIHGEVKEAITILENIHASGKDIKLFLKQYIKFLLDVGKYFIGCDWKYIRLPQTETNRKWFDSLDVSGDDVCSINNLLEIMLKVDSDIKYSPMPLYDIEGAILTNY